MINKEKAVEIIYEELSEVYCHNCDFDSGVDNRELDYFGCDYCIRKSMGWRISKATAQSIVNKIMESEKE